MYLFQEPGTVNYELLQLFPTQISARRRCHLVRQVILVICKAEPDPSDVLADIHSG